MRKAAEMQGTDRVRTFTNNTNTYRQTNSITSLGSVIFIESRQAVCFSTAFGTNRRDQKTGRLLGVWKDMTRRTGVRACRILERVLDQYIEPRGRQMRGHRRSPRGV